MTISKVEVRVGDRFEELEDIQAVSIEQIAGSKLCKITVVSSKPHIYFKETKFEPVELLRSNGVEWHFLYLSLTSGTGEAPAPVLIVLS